MARVTAGLDSVIYWIDDRLSGAVCWVADMWCTLRHDGHGES